MTQLLDWIPTSSCRAPTRHLQFMLCPSFLPQILPMCMAEVGLIKLPKKYYFTITMKTELVTTLKRQATKLLKELREEKEPILITEHGKPSAYLVDVDQFEQIQKKLTLLEGLARGEKAILEDRIVSHKDAKKRMARWLE